MKMLDSRSGGTSHFGNEQAQAADSAPATQASHSPQPVHTASASAMPPSPPPQSYDDFDDDIPF
jgi:single-strand DNA-binding protein